MLGWSNEAGKKMTHTVFIFFQIFQWFQHMYWMSISATYRWKNIKESTAFSGTIHALKCVFWWVIIGQGGRYTIQPPKQSEAGVSMSHDLVQGTDKSIHRYWPALRAGLLRCNFFGQPGSVSKFPRFVWVKLWVGWVGRGYIEISRYFPALWINRVTLVTKTKLWYSLGY